MSLLSRLERNLGRYAIPDLSLYLIIGQVMILGFALLGQFDVGRIMLLPAAVRAGEFWRLGTFLLVPPVTTLTLTSALFLAFGWYLFYLMGSALEQHWGALRFNGFILLGWLLTVGAAFVTPALYATNAYMAATVFLAFAYLNPDFVTFNDLRFDEQFPGFFRTRSRAFSRFRSAPASLAGAKFYGG